MIEVIRSKFAYDHWANRRALESIRSLPAPDEKASRCLGHIILAHKFWFRRLHGEPPPPSHDMFPLHSPEELDAQIEDLRELWAGYLEELTEEKLASQIYYVTIKGNPFESSVQDILLHVANHGTYHRGQIAMLVRERGGEPLATDFIIHARGG